MVIRRALRGRVDRNGSVVIAPSPMLELARQGQVGLHQPHRHHPAGAGGPHPGHPLRAADGAGVGEGLRGGIHRREEPLVTRHDDDRAAKEKELAKAIREQDTLVNALLSGVPPLPRPRRFVRHHIVASHCGITRGGEGQTPCLFDMSREIQDGCRPCRRRQSPVKMQRFHEQAPSGVCSDLRKQAHAPKRSRLSAAAIRSRV